MSVKVAVHPDLLALSKQFAGFDLILQKYLAQADVKVAVELVAQSVQAQDWKNGMGVLETSMTYYKITPTYYEAGSNLPYAMRRDKGFSGHTDRRGRYYANDPGKFFMETSLTKTIPDAQVAYVKAVTMALQELVGIAGV